MCPATNTITFLSSRINGILWCVLPDQKQKSHENRFRRSQLEVLQRKYSNFIGRLSYIFVTNACYIFSVNCSSNLMWSAELYTVAGDLVTDISLWSVMLHHVVLYVFNQNFWGTYHFQLLPFCYYWLQEIEKYKVWIALHSIIFIIDFLKWANLLKISNKWHSTVIVDKSHRLHFMKSK
jgi:hypothetical protein